MRNLLVLAGLALALCGCSSDVEDATTQAPERDGFSGQMGVMAGDPSDYAD